MTRLITSYKEAKALKDAGYPPICNGPVRIYDTMGDTCFPPHEAYHHYNGPEDISDRIGMVLAPRLDELLGWLWDRRYDVSWYGFGAPNTRCELNHNTDDADADMVVDGAFSGHDRLASVVQCVLHDLNSERSPE